jgi:tetratricopeptide (TPR) repeat protein
VREEPGNTEALHALVSDLLTTGYHQDAIVAAEQFVDRDPLVPAAHYHLSDALYAVGRYAESAAELEEAGELGMDLANWMFGIRKLMDKQDDAAIAHFEATLQQRGYPDSTWVRDLVRGARDPIIGQAFLDRRISELFTSLPEDDPLNLRGDLIRWYLALGFVDRYLELILALDLERSAWSDAVVPVYEGTVYWRLGFTANPKYLEVVQAMGIVDLWERRGPPDFCNKVDDQWVCE